MAEKKLDTGPEGQLGLEDVVKDEPGGGAGGPGDVEVSAEQIEELLAAQKAAERAALEPEGAGGSGEKAAEAGAPGKEEPPAPETVKPRRGRPPKAEQEAPGGREPGTAGKSKQGRAAKKEKPSTEKAKAPKKEKASRAPKGKGGGGGPASGPAADTPPAPEPTVPREPPRSGETEQIVSAILIYKDRRVEIVYRWQDEFQYQADLLMQAQALSVKEAG